MNKRKGTLEKLKEFVRPDQEPRPARAAAQDILRRLGEYYALYDLEHATVRAYLFERLVSSSDGYEEIADRAYIGLSSLKRFVKSCDRLAEILLKRQAEEYPLIQALIR